MQKCNTVHTNEQNAKHKQPHITTDCNTIQQYTQTNEKMQQYTQTNAKMQHINRHITTDMHIQRKQTRCHT